MEDKQCFKKFWPFYLDSKIVDPSLSVSRGSLLGPSDGKKDLKGISLGPIFELEAFSGSDPAFVGIS